MTLGTVRSRDGCALASTVDGDFFFVLSQIRAWADLFISPSSSCSSLPPSLSVPFSSAQKYTGLIQPDYSAVPSLVAALRLLRRHPLHRQSRGNQQHQLQLSHTPGAKAALSFTTLSRSPQKHPVNLSRRPPQKPPTKPASQPLTIVRPSLTRLVWLFDIACLSSFPIFV